MENTAFFIIFGPFAEGSLYMNESLLFLQGLPVALFLGALVGIEREKDFADKRDHHQFGIRTLSMIGVLSYTLYWFFADEPVIFGLFIAGFFALVSASYWKTSIEQVNTGVATELAGVFVFLNGILVAMGEVLIASALTLLVLLLLFFKENLHKFAYGVSTEEIYAGLKFIAIAFIILPLLPNETMGPLDVLNPYAIWFVVVLISSISLLSYIAIKALGPRNGIGFGGFLGGLVSSTAVAMSFSALSKKNKHIINPFVFGILIACTAMFFRVLLEVFILNPALLESLLTPMLLMGVLGIAISLFVWISSDHKKTANFDENKLQIESPFQLKTALQFAVLFASLLIVSKYANLHFGSQGLYLTAFFSGIMDVDAITVSMANLNRLGEISANSASNAIVIATITNTLSKAFIVFFFASKQVAFRVFGALAFVLLAGGLTLLLL